jgi:hypothetical protein
MQAMMKLKDAIPVYMTNQTLDTVESNLDVVKPTTHVLLPAARRGSWCWRRMRTACVDTPLAFI